MKQNTHYMQLIKKGHPFDVCLKCMEYFELAF